VATVAVAVPRRVALVPLFALAAGGALLVAVRAPLATVVLGLIGFGVLHNVLELRYVAGRFADVLRGRFLLLLVGLVSGIVVCRLAGARTPEILLAYAMLAAGVVHAVRATGARVAALAGLAVAMATSLTWPAYHFVVLAHLHNVVPLVFLWEWARALPAGRAAFRVAQLVWVLGTGVAALLAVLFVADYRQGRLLYASFASYHAYLEFPVLLALLFGGATRTPPPG
jgi:hypothetical protein